VVRRGNWARQHKQRAPLGMLAAADCCCCSRRSQSVLAHCLNATSA
jgi:hypothetical protein